MCQILLSIANTERPPLVVLRRAKYWNPHGFGLSYAKDNQLFVDKGNYSFDVIQQKIAEVPPDVNLIMHFRNASHGGFEEKYCHPFSINENLCFHHNGILSNGFGTKNVVGDSDTFAFNERFLKPLFKFIPDIEGNENELKSILEPLIWDGKVVLQNNKGDYLIINEKFGVWNKSGFWISNYHSLAKIPKAAALKLKFMELINKKELTEISRKDKAPDVAALLKE